MNKDIEKLFKEANGYVETDDEGNRSHAPPRLTPQTVLLC